jgi:hypothetical protein
VFADISRKRFEDAFRQAMLFLKYGGENWKCSQCRVTASFPPPKDASEGHECPKCQQGIPMVFSYVGPSPHSLRASCVVFYREAGLPDFEIMKITGHKSLATFRGYSRSTVENLKKQMDAALKSRAKFVSDLERAQPKVVMMNA